MKPRGEMSNEVLGQLIHESENFKSQTCLKMVILVSKDQKLAKHDLYLQQATTAANKTIQ
ncbi:hypothetical protein E2562_000146 [Oryza meyeriana var. granulata]|uniref:Uncharacterized protein n=1 Tax=Oryza meyeriana var. granulata TaxID=110450 RepID=A0A6G1DC04_9ORYZ|nr:hypothetical protein E2562_000146 [Oryza meyeriana var. granulata]